MALRWLFATSEARLLFWRPSIYRSDCLRPDVVVVENTFGCNAPQGARLGRTIPPMVHFELSVHGGSYLRLTPSKHRQSTGDVTVVGMRRGASGRTRYACRRPVRRLAPVPATVCNTWHPLGALDLADCIFALSSNAPSPCSARLVRWVSAHAPQVVIICILSALYPCGGD